MGVHEASCLFGARDHSGASASLPGAHEGAIDGCALAPLLYD